VSDRVLRDLEGRTAIVTGGASGIGRAAATMLASRGAQLVVADIDADNATIVADEIEDAGGAAIGVPTDVTDPAQVRAMVETTIGSFGGLHVAVHCAGTPGSYAALADQRFDDWQRTLAINLSSAFLCMQAEMPKLLESGAGSIVNVASAAGLMGFAHLPAYVASKHGLVGLTKSVALEVARKGVRVNAVCPGNVRTPMLEGFTGGDEQALEGMGRMTPIGRLAEPHEVAEAIVWLCSDAASYVTGHAFAVDGGVLAT
jgi:NAD(P)-dependent dehydrogenase (short-subunit alcohol dehydrogenase family)